MKPAVAKALKITSITLGSIVGVVLIAVSILCYVVFTPKRLTPIVNQVADSLLTCPHELEEVNLTFFRTFPNFGVSVKGLYIINPTDGAQSDTLLAAPEIIASVKLFDAIKGDIYINQCHINNAEANLYIAADGITNFDIINLTDTVEEDTVPSAWQLRSIGWDEDITLNARKLTFVDKKDTITAALSNVNLSVAALEKNDMQGACLSVQANHINVNFKGEQYADSLELKLKLPALLADGTERVIVDGTQLQINQFKLTLDGEVGTPCFSSNIYNCNVTLKTDDWQIQPLLALVPKQFTSALTDIDVDGEIKLEANAKGTYSDSIMPLVTAHVELNKGEGQYKPLPYKLQNIALNADATLDLNDEKASAVKINNLKAKTKNTTISAKGQVTELLADMLLNIQATINANIPDFKYFIPEGMDVTGHAKGDVKAKIRLSDLTNMRLEKGLITGDLNLDDICYTMDSMTAVLPANKVSFRIPNSKPTWRKLTWLELKMEMDKLTFQQPGLANVDLGASNLRVELGDVMKTMPIIYANVDLTSSQRLVADMDTIKADIKTPHLTAYVELDTKDTTNIPIVNAKMAFDDLKCQYTDINAHLQQSELEAKLSGSARLKSAPRLSASIRSQAMNSNMGKDVKMATDHFFISAQAAYNPDAKKHDENILLQWNPRLHFDMNKAEVDLAAFPQHISVPQLSFDYSNRKFKIETSKIKLGDSDFSLTGEVRNIGKWLQERDTLLGELNFVSEHTDVNQLMELFSADSGSEETPAQAATEAPDENDGKGPFLVPQRVDLVLNTSIKEAKVFKETAYNLGGRVYVKDGALVLEEMGFVCNAAKLQLTAMYRTPRRNHLYLGLDYHMIDVDIEALISMIPQIDSMIPMLKSFKGDAEFHLAGETFLNQNYQIKTSTLRGACSLFGKDLVVLDSETFDQIAKLLMFKKSTENKVDSISAEITLYKKEVDVYPFVVSMDNYMVALGGRHNLDMTFDYHVNVLSPIYLGVDVKGKPDDLSIKLAKCIYAKDFKPIFHKDVDQRSAELRSIIRESMRKNVKIK